MSLRRLGVCAVCLLLFTVTVLAQQSSPLGLNPEPVVEPLAVQVWMDKGSYVEGEAAQIMFSVNQPAYVYILNIQSDGIVRLIFPNAYSQQNFVSAGVHTLPDGLYQFLITPPAGTDHLQILATLAPLQFDASSTSEPYPIVGQDPNAALDAIQVQIQGISGEATCTPQWATDWCSFTISAAPQQTSCYCAPPVCTVPTYTCPTYTCPTYTPPACACPTYTPPTCTVPTYTPPTCTIRTYTYPCPPVSTSCSPCLFPFLSGSLRVCFGVRIHVGIDCDD